MHWTRRGILWSFHLLLFIVPLIFLPNTSELFEFNKMIVTYILTIFVAFFWLSRMAAENRIVFKKTLLDWPILIFLISQLLSLLLSVDIRTSLLGYYSRYNGGLVSLLCYAILYWSAVSNLESKNIKSLISSTLISSTLVALWGFLEHLGVDASWWVQDVQNRVFSTLGQPNWLAAYLCALIFLPLGSYLKSKNLTSYLLFGFLFLVLLFTKSRSGLLAFGISSLVFWIYYVWNLKIKKFRNLLVIGNWSLIIIISLLVFPNPIKDLLFKIPTSELKTSPTTTSLEQGGSQSTAIRKIVWTGAIRIWQSSAKNFWLGTGPETFAMTYYQHRPVAHNNTSEWELLYNKAHNEFLNYLATTGVIGLSSYLILIFSMFYILIKSQIPNHNNQTITNHQKTNHKYLELGTWNLEFLALLAGWLTISITNFWGFSVVIIQIFLFLFPAFTIVLNQPVSPDSPPTTPKSFSSLIIILLLLIASYGVISVGKYWLADTYYAKGDTAYQSFTVTNEPVYLLAAYKNYSLAHEASPQEPVITAQLAFSTAYMSLLASSQDATTSAQMAKYAQSLADLAISQNPHHPNIFKTVSKAMIVLGVSDETKLLIADRYLAAAQKISPTDPRIPFNRGLIYKQLKQADQATTLFNQAVSLKPDFNDPKVALQDL